MPPLLICLTMAAYSSAEEHLVFDAVICKQYNSLSLLLVSSIQAAATSSLASSSLLIASGCCAAKSMVHSAYFPFGRVSSTSIYFWKFRTYSNSTYVHSFNRYTLIPFTAVTATARMILHASSCLQGLEIASLGVLWQLLSHSYPHIFIIGLLATYQKCSLSLLLFYVWYRPSFL